MNRGVTLFTHVWRGVVYPIASWPNARIHLAAALIGALVFLPHLPSL